MKKSEEKIETKSYTMSYWCTNCKRYFNQVFLFGERAYQGTCPNCGVPPKGEYNL